MGEQTAKITGQNPKAIKPENGDSRSLFSTLVRCGFLLLVFSLALMTPPVWIKNRQAALTDFLFLLVFLCWLAGIWLGHFKFRRHPFYFLLLFYFAAMLLSAIFSPNQAHSLIKLGGETYLLLLAVLSFNLVKSEKDFKQLIYAWLAGTCLAVSIGAATIFLFYYDPQNPLLSYTVSKYGAVPIGNYPRVQSTFVSASLFCNYLTASLAMLFIALQAKLIGRRSFLGLFFLILVSAVFTISSGFGGVPLLIGVWLWMIFRKTRPRPAQVFLWSSLSIALGFYVMNFFALAPHPTAPYSIALPMTDLILYPSPRLLVWSQSFRTFTENFFTGAGLGMPVCEVLFLNTDGNYSLLTDAHNILLNVAAQSGIFGFVSVVLIGGHFLRLGRKMNIDENFSTILLRGLLLAILSCFVYQGLTGSFENARHIWVLFGLVLSARELQKTKCEGS